MGVASDKRRMRNEIKQKGQIRSRAENGTLSECRFHTTARVLSILSPGGEFGNQGIIID
jgi:hypothetical protein